MSDKNQFDPLETVDDAYEDELIVTLDLDDGSSLDCVVLTIFSVDD